MPKIDHHAPGGFCWIELATTDQNAAKEFYEALFGWTAVDMPMGPGSFYTMFQIDGADAAAGYTMTEQEQGIPPHWNLYIAVEDADAAAKEATGLGGTVLAQPFDVMDAGRMAVIQDPTGAVFCCWQAKNSPGIAITGENGTLCWADLSTPDAASAQGFYEGLLGWTIAASENDPSGYIHIKNGEEFIGGIPPAAHRNPDVPPHWLVYILAADVDATASQAQELGGSVLLPPMTMENVGRMAVIADPQGAPFAIFTSAR
jgi:predicted enzyme related to lactoylglutathione lyase